MNQMDVEFDIYGNMKIGEKTYYFNPDIGFLLEKDNFDYLSMKQNTLQTIEDLNNKVYEFEESEKNLIQKVEKLEKGLSTIIEEKIVEKFIDLSTKTEMLHDKMNKINLIVAIDEDSSSSSSSSSTSQNMKDEKEEEKKEDLTISDNKVVEKKMDLEIDEVLKTPPISPTKSVESDPKISETLLCEKRVLTPEQIKRSEENKKQALERRRLYLLKKQQEEREKTLNVDDDKKKVKNDITNNNNNNPMKPIPFKKMTTTNTSSFNETYLKKVVFPKGEPRNIQQNKRGIMIPLKVEKRNVKGITGIQPYKLIR